MLQAILRRRHMTGPHPAPELLVPYALGAHDAAIARHVATCPTCRADIEQLQEATRLLRGPVVLEHRDQTPECLDEFVTADFVDGRLGTDARASAVAHLTTCAHCRSVVSATSRLNTEPAVHEKSSARRWRRWSLPVGLAAAAAIVLLLLPRVRDESTPELREPAVTSTIAPTPITPAPGASVARLDSLVWSSVPKAERYRVRLYDGEGSVVWTLETPDTSAAVPNSLRLQPRVEYFWRVEAQAEWMRWTASDLVSFRITAQR
jgi:hypothetical protein